MARNVFQRLHLSRALVEDERDNQPGRCFKGISRYYIVVQLEKRRRAQPGYPWPCFFSRVPSGKGETRYGKIKDKDASARARTVEREEMRENGAYYSVSTHRVLKMSRCYRAESFARSRCEEGIKKDGSAGRERGDTAGT